MATGVSDGRLLMCVFDGCISAGDAVVERRPYHKNCGCALHEKKSRGGGACPHAPGSNSVSFPIRRSWSEGCLSMLAGDVPGHSSSPSSCSSPRPAVKRKARLQSMGNRGEECLLFKICED